ncbi:ribose-phosphate pyrophosphokinase [Neolewinella agarilytica]|uniref:ribose-phosphate diphosphokinase n=1 Tax=Neolewinella agarilytica TaxID=478744 RepID=A0A1H9F1I2_9BACT|nr:ribose-phosphate pyrophosphokinase [Neolewinella agarilytica]SEQ31822.1 ribose-phosphate pyrophosphokinase [Neolewinella agarilytica]
MSHKPRLTPMNDNVTLLSVTGSQYLSEKIATAYGQELGELEVARFNDGEMQPIIKQSVRGEYVFIIGSTFQPHDNLMEMLLTIDAARRASAGYICCVMPYFGYARQDRKDRPRVPISAKLIANLLVEAGADRIMTLDLHADQIQGFFDIPVDHLKSQAIYIPYFDTQDMSNVTFASPDMGGVKRARDYAKYYERNVVICDKYRKRAGEIAGMTLIGDVEGADVILVDDLVDTAGTLCRAADLIMERGAKSVRAIATHPILSGNAYEKIEKSALETLIVCDAVPLKQISPKIKVLSSAALFAKGIKKTHDNESISALFVG